MKKFIVICLAILFAFTLCSCGESGRASNDPREQPTSTKSGGPVSSDKNDSSGGQSSNPAQSDPGDSNSTPDPWSDPGDTGSDNPGQGDPGDTNQHEWWGTYKSDDLGFSIEITEYSGSDFWAEIILLRNGNVVLAGRAAISAEDDYLAVLDDIGFYLYEDYSAIDIVASESSDLAHMRGQYMKIE